jgi:NADPH:quinone reductase-like Zn-dependent oxidoreductase
MRAAWYEQKGPARDVLVVGAMPEPVPERGEVRVRLPASGITQGDTKQREGWLPRCRTRASSTTATARASSTPSAMGCQVR